VVSAVLGQSFTNVIKASVGYTSSSKRARKQASKQTVKQVVARALAISLPSSLGYTSSNERAEQASRQAGKPVPLSFDQWTCEKQRQH